MKGKHYKRSTRWKRFVKYLRRTWVNKVVAVAAVAACYVPVILDDDGTAFVFALMFAIPMFFARDNWIAGGEF